MARLLPEFLPAISVCIRFIRSPYGFWIAHLHVPGMPTYCLTLAPQNQGSTQDSTKALPVCSVLRGGLQAVILAYLFGAMK